MIAILFIYAFMSGACYSIGINEIKKEANFKPHFIDSPLALICGLLWPILFSVFIMLKVSNVCSGKP
jgi:hypothetical protein